MPPLALLPSRPTGSPDITSYGYGAGMSPTYHASSSGSGDTMSPEQWDEYIAIVQEGLRQSSGWQREQARMQLEDAEKGRANAYRIAQLQAQTSRYGTDANTAAELARLKENARQFDANHALDMQKFGLDEKRFGLDERRFGLEQNRYGLDLANSYVKYASSPDMRWSANDFDTAVRRAGLGQSPQPISTQSAPQPKGWQDWAALTGYGGLPAVQSGQKPEPAGAQGAMPGAGAVNPGVQGGADARIKAIRAVADAIPPSESPGADENDWAALNAFHSLYFANKPGAVEKLGHARLQTGLAGLRRLGYDTNLTEEDRLRNTRLGQKSVYAA